MSLNKRILLFDLDGTLLQNDKTISKRTLKIVESCRKKGFLLGIATSRSEARSIQFIKELSPEILILSGGAVVKFKEDYIYVDAFSIEDTNGMIRFAREICGQDCGITMDTLHEHFSNSNKHLDGGSKYSEFENFEQPGLKLCVEVADENKAKHLAERLTNCDCSRFFGEDWYKFTKKTSTKEIAIQKLCKTCDFLPEEIIAFGDDQVDIEMLKLCGIGVAMGNSIEEVKQIADVVIGNNDEDGIAEYLERYHL